jgi:hypothetical protein
VPILDHYCPVEQQPQQMAAAAAELVRRGKARARSGVAWKPASLPCLREVVDFETTESDSRDGMGKTVAFYWCVSSPAYHQSTSSRARPAVHPKTACANARLAQEVRA